MSEPGRGGLSGTRALAQLCQGVDLAKDVLSGKAIGLFSRKTPSWPVQGLFQEKAAPPGPAGRLSGERRLIQPNSGSGRGKTAPLAARGVFPGILAPPGSARRRSANSRSARLAEASMRESAHRQADGGVDPRRDAAGGWCRRLAGNRWPKRPAAASFVEKAAHTADGSAAREIHGSLTPWGRPAGFFAAAGLRRALARGFGRQIRPWPARPANRRLVRPAPVSRRKSAHRQADGGVDPRIRGPPG